jgi:hypothetical protein
MVLLGQPNRLAHMVEVGCVESTRDVCHRNERHERFVIAHPVEAERFAHIAIDRRQGLLPVWLSVERDILPNFSRIGAFRI